MDNLVTLITNVGFPIVVCIICFWYINESTKTHKEEVDSLKEAIASNTLVLQQLIDKIENLTK